MSGLTRREAVTLMAGAVLLGRVELSAASGDYWAFADRCQRLLDDLWSPGLGHYQSGGRGETSINANLLFTHASAALAGHTGAARQDARARILAQRLLQVPPYRPEGTGPPPTGLRWDQTHDWGWGATMDSHEHQHVAIDAAVVRGLAQTWLARAQLGLDPLTADVVHGAVQRCATSPWYAYPALRLNQINWPLEIFAWAVAIGGDPRLAYGETRKQLGRFADALTRTVPPYRIPFTGPGYRFHYVPGDRENARANLDSPEYAAAVCGALQFYEPALRAGMDPLLPRQREALRAWVERVLCGYFTHAGYLNWDTGASFRRWHQGTKFGLAQAALLAIATTPSLQPAPEYGRWATYLFDRGLELFDRWARDGLPPAVYFGVTRTPGGVSEARQSAARIQANAARAATLGLGAAEPPPPLYAYDPDVGRLAVTTPTYSTAITVVDRERLPYGGAELARLFDGAMRPAANIGGRPPAAFGVLARGPNRTVASQRGRPRGDLRHPPLRLLEAPRGAVARPEAYPRRPYAGPFTRLTAVAITRDRALTIETLHRFRPDHIETRWTIEPRRPRGRWTVEVLFPSTGAVTVTEHDGWFHVGGYVVVPRGEFAGHHLVRPEPQDSAPDPGPTLVIELGRLRPLRLAVRLAPASDDAAAVAARLQRG
jgi:hypothetical protein